MFWKKITFSPSSFWQSNLWNDILLTSRQCIKTQWITLSESRKLLIEIRTVWIGLKWAFIIGYSGDIYQKDIEYISHYIWSDGCIFLQIECLSGSIASDRGQRVYRHFLEPYTRAIDLTVSEGEILSQMHEKWRYNIRLAEKRGVTTEWMSPNEENINIWMDLVSETTLRDSFSHNSRLYYQTFLNVLSENNAWGLLFAFYQWRVIAAGIFAYFWESAIYYYWASTSDRDLRKHMAPYLLQWHALIEWKNRGCFMYDLLGIAPPGSLKSSLQGVTDFKEKFWGEIIELGDKKIFPLSWKYSVFIGIRWLKNLIRK